MRRSEKRPADFKRAGWWIGVALLSGVAALAAQTAASEKAETFSVFNGQQSYKSFCMNCHGVDGKGDGYLAPNLSARPTDLTTLAKKNGGVYPAERVSTAIDGRLAVKEHGRREMPVWGDAFLWPEQESPERREAVRRRIGELVEYLRSVQDPPPAATPGP